MECNAKNPTDFADSFELRATEGMLGATLALMSAYGACTCARPVKDAMAMKIIRGLSILEGDSALSEGFRDLLLNIKLSWCAHLEQVHAIPESTHTDQMAQIIHDASHTLQ
jgi:hypothetical protein